MAGENENNRLSPKPSRTTYTVSFFGQARDYLGNRDFLGKAPEGRGSIVSFPCLPSTVYRLPASHGGHHLARRRS
jgi:hypothetical protein